MKIRPAREDELSELLRIQLDALGLADLLAELSSGEVPALMRHALVSGETLVAVDDDRLAGFSVGYERDGTWFLGEFFVRPDVQSTGIGQALLSRAKPDGIPCATVSTSDHRAQALYARSGMTPRWPSFNLRASAGTLMLPESMLDICAVDNVDGALIDLDRRISGRIRPEDMDFLMRGWNGMLARLLRGGEVVGYAGLARRGRGRVSVGPVGALHADDATACVTAAIRWASGLPGTETVTIDIPGCHPGFPALLEAGFLIEDQNIFFASDPERFGNPRRYLPLTPAIY